MDAPGPELTVPGSLYGLTSLHTGAHIGGIYGSMDYEFLIQPHPPIPSPQGQLMEPLAENVYDTPANTLPSWWSMSS